MLLGHRRTVRIRLDGRPMTVEHPGPRVVTALWSPTTRGPACVCSSVILWSRAHSITDERSIEGSIPGLVGPAVVPHHIPPVGCAP